MAILEGGYSVFIGGKCVAEGKAAVRSAQSRFEGSVRKLIRDELRDYARRLTEDECAHMLGISARTMRRRLSNLCAPAYRQLRSEETELYGRELLTTTNRSLAWCAHACGFARHSAFTRFMNRRLGENPKDYRAKHSTAFALIGRHPIPDVKLPGQPR